MAQINQDYFCNTSLIINLRLSIILSVKSYNLLKCSGLVGWRNKAQICCFIKRMLKITQGCNHLSINPFRKDRLISFKGLSDFDVLCFLLNIWGCRHLMKPFSDIKARSMSVWLWHPFDIFSIVNSMKQYNLWTQPLPVVHWRGKAWANTNPSPCPLSTSSQLMLWEHDWTFRWILS